MSRGTAFPIELHVRSANTINMSRGTAFPIELHVRPANTDQPAHPRNLIRVLGGHSMVVKDPNRLHAGSQPVLINLGPVVKKNQRR